MLTYDVWKLEQGRAHKIADKTSWEGAGTKEGFIDGKRLKIWKIDIGCMIK